MGCDRFDALISLLLILAHGLICICAVCIRGYDMYVPLYVMSQPFASIFTLASVPILSEWERGVSVLGSSVNS